MSLCSNTLRALWRSRVPKSKTLLPFLYQTATIQQWKPATRPIARRTISSRSNVDDGIPFENAHGNLPLAIDEAQSARKTTITGTERAAFEKLYKTFNTQGQGRAKENSRELEELDQIADEYYEDDEDTSGTSLDRVFDAVLQDLPRSQQSRKDGGKLKMTMKTSGGNTTSAKETSTPESETAQSEKKRDAKAERDKIKKLRMEERERVNRLMKNAQTDRELWQILEREVFDQLRKLNLDGTNPTKKERFKNNTLKRPSKVTASAIADKRILFPNYQHHLHTAIYILRAYFPTSQLPLTILPTIKSLGRSSYALGATTTLYKQLLRTAWLQQSSYALIDMLLTDMDSNVVEVDAGILEVLDAVIREHEMARSGRLGREMQMVYGMEQWVEGVRKVREWRDVIAGRLGVKRDDGLIMRAVRRPVERIERMGGDGIAVRPLEDVPLVEGKNGAEGRSHGNAVEVVDAAKGDAIPFVGEQGLMTENTNVIAPHLLKE